MLVKAIAKGEYQGLRAAGAIFELEERETKDGDMLTVEEQFSPAWMVRVDAEGNELPAGTTKKSKPKPKPKAEEPEDEEPEDEEPEDEEPEDEEPEDEEPEDEEPEDEEPEDEEPKDEEPAPKPRRRRRRG